LGFQEEKQRRMSMRKTLFAGVTLAALTAMPIAANAQANVVGGAAIGAGTGALIGGPPGAIVGGVIGGTVGAATEPRTVYVEPRRAQRVCWFDDWGRRHCRWR
jgi:hypothetical protein